MTVAPGEELTRWNLREYYAGTDDPRIDVDLSQARKDAAAFRSRYQGRIASLDPTELRIALENYEALGMRLSDLSDFGFLSFCMDTRDEKAQALNARLQGETGAIRGDIAFLLLELQHLPEDAYQKLGEEPGLTPWRDQFARLRRRAPHALDDAVERAITRKDQAGIQAWRQLYNTITSSRPVMLPGSNGPREATVAEAAALASGPDRELRNAASEALITSLTDRSDVITNIYNAVLEDARITAELRGYDRAYGELLVDEDLDEAAVEALMSAVESRYDLVHRYLRLKAKALGIEDFAAWDINAPIGTEPPSYPYAEARRVVHDAYADFHPRMGDMIDRFFDGGYIDARPVPGKWVGAFCSWSCPGRHPYLLISYTNRIRDLLTLAHELGHGLHYRFVDAKDRYMNLRISVFSETPSTFGELLAFERLVAEAPDAAVRQTLLGAWLDTTVGTLFLQVALTRWEQRIHARRSDGPLATDDFCQTWLDERRKLFGPDVHLPDWTAYGWLGHQHAIGMPFYCLNYPFGLTLVYALRQRLREEGPKFADAFVGLLEAGLSPAAADLLGTIGVDVRDPAFWHQGLRGVEALIDEFEAAVG